MLNKIFFKITIFVFAIFFATDSFAATIARPMHNSGLVGYWNFEEGKGSGTAYDRSGRGNNGTLTNMNTGTSWVQSSTTGSALQFAGDDDYVLVQHSTSLNLSGTMTISAWIKIPAGSSGYREIYRKGNSYFLLLNDANKLALSTSAAQAEYDNGFAYTADNLWHLVTGTFDGTTCRMYLDGVFQISYACGYPTPDTNTIGIGANAAGFSQYLTGSVDEVRIYNRALSADEALRLYKIQKPKLASGRNDTGLVSYYTFDEMTGTRTEDSSVNTNTGTFSGAPLWVAGRNGGALSFDGVDDEVQVSSAFGLGIASYSIGLWVNLDSTSEKGAFVKIGNSTTGIAIGVGSTNFDTLGNNLIVLQEAVRWIDTGIPIGTGWHYIVLAAEPNGYPRVFLDGVSVYSDNAQWGIAPAGNVTYIGGYTGSGAENRHSDVTVDEVRIYNRELGATEIKGLYSGSKASVVGKTNKQKVTNGLVGHWTFDGKDMYGTTALDSSGNNNIGVLTNGPTLSRGKVGQGVNFAGTINDNITISYSSTLDIPDSGGSITAWIYSVNPLGQTTSEVIAVREGHGNPAADGNWALWVNQTEPAGAHYLVGQLGSINDVDNCDGWDNGGIAIPERNFYHVGMSWDSSRIYLYVNGVLSHSCARTKTLVYANSLPVQIGGNFRGTIDDVRIYNRKITTDEVKALYQSGR